MERKARVVIIGAGFGGLAAAKELKDMPVQISVVDKRNHHTFQPLLYQVATAGLDVDDICYATRGIFHRQRNARALKVKVNDIDFENRKIKVDSGKPLNYDYLIIAAGAVTADYGVEGVQEFSFGLKSGADAVKIRNHVLRCFEKADRSQDVKVAESATTIVIAGGGPTGVEMAGGFAELVHKVLKRDFPALDIDRSRIVLVEGQDKLLGTFSPKLGRKAKRRLAAMGVEVRLSTQVTKVTDSQVELSDGSVIASDTLVWAAGVKANPLAEILEVETSRGGRIVVDENLKLPGQDNVYIVGDLAAAKHADENLVPQVAPAAIQQGKHAAKMISADIMGEKIQPFQYVDKGSMATIGRNSAVVELPGGTKLSGFLGWGAWLALHLVMLIGFRNRANVLVNWAWNYITYDRGSRLILDLLEE